MNDIPQRHGRGRARSESRLLPTSDVDSKLIWDIPGHSMDKFDLLVDPLGCTDGHEEKAIASRHRALGTACPRQ